MKILVEGTWRNGFLDYYRDREDIRVQVLALKNLDKLQDLFFLPPRDLKLLLNYLAEIGFINVLRKIASRFQEKYRNEKYVSVGLGKVIDFPENENFKEGQIVAFLAPCHPACFERVVLPKGLIIKVDQSDVSKFPENSICYQPHFIKNRGEERWWSSLAGWNSLSGVDLCQINSVEVMKKVKESICAENWMNARQLIIDPGSVPKEIRKQSGTIRANKKKKAALFGYGNYAKVIILPNIRRLNICTLLMQN